MGVDKAYYQEKLAPRGGSPHYGRIQKAIRAFRRHVPRVERLLDVGCDDGRISLAIKEAMGAEEVYGIEAFEEAYRLALGRGMKCVQMDLDREDFPFPDGHFDAIFCGEVIEHLFDPDHLLDEIYRTLSPQGVCVISTPNLASLVNRIALLFGLQPFMTAVSLRHIVGRVGYRGLHGPDHIRAFTFRAFKELVLLHGFRVPETQGLTASDGSDPPFPLPIRLVERAIALIPSFAHTVQLVLAKGVVPNAGKGP